MAEKLPSTRPEISQWLDISQSTLRNWDSKFRKYLDADVGQKGRAIKKQYPPEDLRVFQTVQRLLAEGHSFADMIGDEAKGIEPSIDFDAELLKTRLDTAGWDSPDAGKDSPQDGEPAATEGESAAGKASPSGGALLGPDEAEYIRRLAALGGNLQAITNERDRLLEERDALIDELAEQRERAAAAEARASLLAAERAERRLTWIDRLLGRGRGESPGEGE